MKVNNILLACLLSISSLLADNDFETSFNYFGNLSASKLNSSGFDLNDYSHDSVDDDLSLTPYSKAGVQLSYYNDYFTFTAQGLVRKNHDSYRGELTWLNVKYDINDDFAIRLGRIQTKVLLNSESLDIDYLHVWAKPPVEVYRLMPIRTYNGLELTYDTTFDAYNFNVSLVTFATYSGKINATKNVENAIDIKDASSLTFTLESENTIYKASYSRSNADIDDTASTIAIVNALSAEGNDMSRYTFNERTIEVASLGIQYRKDNFLLDTEIAHSESNGLLPSSTGAYMMLGYQVNKFTPFIMYAENKNDKDYYDTSAIQTATPATKVALDDTLYLANFSQATSTVGMRYDVKTGMAFKAQVDRITSTNYGSISSSGVSSSGYEKVGVLSRDAGTADKAIYALTVSFSFAY